MKSTIFLTGVVMVFLSALIACQKHYEATPKFEKAGSSGITLNADKNAVTLAAAEADKTAVTFTWTDPKYPATLAATKFVLSFDKNGNNFSNPTKREFTGVLIGVLTGAITTIDLNGLALKHAPGQASAVLDVKVTASLSNNNQPISSNTMQITVTPYSAFTLKPASAALVCSPSNGDDTAVTFEWTRAFSGFTGVVTYQFQYAKAGTNFASPVSEDVTASSKAYTYSQLNVIALSQGVVALTSGNVEFRVAATSELGAVQMTGISTLSITSLAYASIGIIGDATAGGWETDSDLYRPDATGKPVEWQGIFYLTGGKNCKFRADDKWDNNWGDTAFPSGTGTGNGPNIPVNTSGYYKVTFDGGTGAYTFTASTVPTVTSVALTGTQFGWGSSDFALTKSTADPTIFTGTTQLEATGVKFRADNAWNVYWGGATFPSGYGIRNPDNGSDIWVSTKGTYFIYINIATGEYFFSPADRGTPYSTVGIVGSATANGWNTDTKLIQNPSMKFRYSATVILKNGAAKFRANEAWDVSWGHTAFPTGTGVSGGSDIPAKEGTYVVHFHTATGEYSFSK